MAMTYCKDFKDHPEINKFVLFSVWCTPGLHIVKDKCMKRKEKLQKLVTDTGVFGPIMDVAIRGSISHLLVLYYGQDTKQITDLSSQGFLRRFLYKYFHDPQLILTIEQLFTKNPQWILDYEYSYRHKRSALIQSQIMFLTQNPHNLVHESLNKYYVHPLKLKLVSRSRRAPQPTFSGIEGYDESAKQFIFSGDSSGPWSQSNDVALFLQIELNKIVSRSKGTKFHIDDVDFGDSKTLSLTEDIDNLFKQLRGVDEHHRECADSIISQCETFFETVMIPRLFNLEMIILIQAFTLKGKPIIDLFYTYNENNERVLRDHVEFCYIMSGGFMALFYKMKIEIYDTEVWNMLKENTDESLPPNNLFGQKVHSDSRKFFRQHDEPQSVLVKISKIARTLQLYKDSYNLKSPAKEINYYSDEESSCCTEDNVEEDCEYTQFVNNDGPQYTGGPKLSTKRKSTKLKYAPKFKSSKSDIKGISSSDFPSDITYSDEKGSQSTHFDDNEKNDESDDEEVKDQNSNPNLSNERVPKNFNPSFQIQKTCIPTSKSKKSKKL